MTCNFVGVIVFTGITIATARVFLIGAHVHSSSLLISVSNARARAQLRMSDLPGQVRAADETTTYCMPDKIENECRSGKVIVPRGAKVKGLG